MLIHQLQNFQCGEVACVYVDLFETSCLCNKRKHSYVRTLASGNIELISIYHGSLDLNQEQFVDFVEHIRSLVWWYNTGWCRWHSGSTTEMLHLCTKNKITLNYLVRRINGLAQSILFLHSFSIAQNALRKLIDLRTQKFWHIANRTTTLFCSSH